ncbi:N-acetylmuramoyl-L-alanine amidase [Bradyrhizobium japonicum]|jgi:N-acetylmuramoyl-L-alanine amidase|uniref:N-acetylmuramoyl-L-alanine amidase n=1 Tax=Bradyrhizobium TaxID=374 RepID=UPI0003A09AD6|nr:MULTISPECIES: N-acetylmuramoyl-L-alanine amidase [Bradyrhizobium]MDH6690003.1 N-acetylmuramoyl-L-alanine amidase [Bradyrhizobium elkanii]UQD83800.1 N-acetylmuramoyl-L-alanine amidase [Bradyrhizobium elkanii USDA 76]WLA42675.1 N-acetylmuramoyl-L-alanine amidase [Bradyrhizobium elkanii]WLA89481.1 N-acetylmuramoyl-L-alanine amidase [Bradyrhizobium elkanii]WLB12380.1 N-acetylmuramoyl-L-alanine amidase [Bradyrhizobium elkanii]
MASSSSSSGNADPKRQRALPVPKGVADAKTFTPDSSIASDVIPSANFGDRANGRQPDMIVLHYTGMPDVEGAITQLCTAGTEVSAHYIVLEDGRIVQCVPESKRAWHAGVSAWAGDDDINSCSIGVEIVNRGHDWGYPDFPLRQIAAVIALCRGIMLRRKIVSHRVLGHSDVAPARKKDPGEKFPWHSLANSGVGHWVQPAPIVRGDALQLGAISDSVSNMQAAFRRYGYNIPTNGKFDGPTMEVVTAFQRHFRPERIDGIADRSTMATLHALLESLPPDAATAVASS